MIICLSWFNGQTKFQPAMFSKILEKTGMLFCMCLEPLTMTLCMYNQEFLLILFQTRAQWEASYQNFKAKEWKNCSPSLNLKPPRWAQLNQSFVLLDNPWLQTSPEGWAVCLKHLWAWNVFGRTLGWRKVYLQEISLLGAGRRGREDWRVYFTWGFFFFFFFFSKEISKQSSFMSKWVFPRGAISDGKWTVLIQSALRICGFCIHEYTGLTGPAILHKGLEYPQIWCLWGSWSQLSWLLKDESINWFTYIPQLEILMFGNLHLEGVYCGLFKVSMTFQFKMEEEIHGFVSLSQHSKN